MCTRNYSLKLSTVSVVPENSLFSPLPASLEDVVLVAGKVLLKLTGIARDSPHLCCLSTDWIRSSEVALVRNLYGFSIFSKCIWLHVWAFHGATQGARELFKGVVLSVGRGDPDPRDGTFFQFHLGCYFGLGCHFMRCLMAQMSNLKLSRQKIGKNHKRLLGLLWLRHGGHERH